jgi:hypothetical protein
MKLEPLALKAAIGPEKKQGVIREQRGEAV